MPRKYDKKTKANFRAGRRNSRRASMRVNMVSPGLSMFNDEFDPAIDDTMLMLKAKGIDRERERFAEALTEVRDRISAIVDDYDTMLEESAHIYRDYIDELQGQASVMPGSKLKHNILRILADYKFVCAEREELLQAVQESMNAQRSSMREVPTFFDDDDDEFDFYTSDTCLRDYTKTLRWFSDKFKDMDAKVCLLKKREFASKGDKKRMKKEKQKEKAKAAENVEKLEPVNSKERLETWKFAAEEIVHLLKTVRQEGEGGKDVLASELQKIMNIMNKQNEEIEKKTELLKKEKEATLRVKQNRDKLQVQIGNLEGKLKSKQNEVATCKQYIQDIVKKMKESPGGIKFSLEGMEDDLQDELPKVMRRRFTLTDSSLEGDFAEMKLRDSQKKASDLEEENSRLQEEVTKLGEAIVQKDRDFIELKAMFSEGEGIACPRCLRLTCTSGSENDTLSPDKDRLEVLEQMLQDSESKLETTVVELARMRINLAASGITLPNLVNVGSQTPADDEESESEDEPDQRGFSHSSLNEESDGSRAGSRLVAEVVITEPSPLVGDSMDETDVLSPQTIRKSSKKQKRKKQTRKDRSRKQTASRSPYPDVNRDDGRYDNTRKDADDDVMESTICSKMSVKMQNKAVQTIHGGLSSAFGRSPLAREALRSIPGSRADTMERIDDLKDEMASLAGGKMEFDSGWRAKLHNLCTNIEEVLDETETGGQLERILSVGMTESKAEDVGDNHYDLCPTEEQFAQNASRKRKSIFMRLVENNFQRSGNMPPDVATIHDTFGRYNRARNIHTPQYIRNIEEEPEMSTPNTHLPALPTQHRPKASKHSLFDTPDVLQTKGETPKPTPPKMPGTPMEKSKKLSHEMQHSEDQVSESEKQSTGILKHTPPKHSDSHPPSHPKDDMKGKVRKQSLTFSGEKEVTAPYKKPFRLRRRSVFGHTNVLEKLASATGLDNTGLSGDSKYVDGESDRFYDGQQEEYIRAVSRGRGSEYGIKDPSTPERALDAQQLRYRRMSRGRFRPSMHPFIGLSEEDRASLTNIYNTRQNAGSRFSRRILNYDDEESEIEVGTLMNDFRRDSLRKAFLSLGLMHLRGDSDDVRADERLTMEDQVNIVAQMAMEVLKATCDVFEKSRRQSQSIPNQQLYKRPDDEEEVEETRERETSQSIPNQQLYKRPDDEEEVEETRERETMMFPPVNTPENNRIILEDEPRDSTDEENKEISLPELAKSTATPEAETTDAIVSKTNKSSMKRSRQGSEPRQRDMLARYAAKRRSLNRSNPFRNLNARKTVMERILGSRMSVPGNMMGNEHSVARFGGMRSHRNSLSRRTFLDNADEFTLTAQAIKLPTQSHQPSAILQPSQYKTKLAPPQGMPKSSSVGAHGLFATGAMKYGPAIEKARSDQTHNRLFIGSRTQEAPRWPAGRMRHTGTRKKL